MNDDLEPRLRALLAERGRPDATAVTGLLGGLDALPARRAGHRRRIAAAVVVIAMIGVGGALTLRAPAGSGEPATPPNPAAFEGDPRMAACFSEAGQVEAAFEMRHARDYQRHLPAMPRSPELEVDDPGFVVIFTGDVQIGGAGGPAPTTGKYVCVLVGATPNLYSGVDVMGLTATLPDAIDDPTPAAVVPTPTPTATASIASPTDEPTPSWVSDLAGQLDCDGAVVDVGQEVPAEPGPMEPAGTPAEALERLLAVGLYAWLPAEGFEPPHIEGAWAAHRYLVDGRLKVMLVSTNHFPGIPEDVGWEVVGLRACDPAEFDPDDGLTDDTRLWLDAEGLPVAATVIFSRPGPGHCGWEAVTFLHLGDVLYLRDPEGALDESTNQRYAEVEAMPADALGTGLHTSEWQLFTVPDKRVVYVRTDDGTIERWARASDDIGCA